MVRSLPNALSNPANKPPIDIEIGGIRVTECESPPQLIPVRAEDGFIINTSFCPADTFRLRSTVYGKLREARAALPSGLGFILYEAFRPRSRQIELWNMVIAKLQAERPELTGDALTEAANEWVSNPNAFGSGHQAGAAIDITLCDAAGNELPMGTKVQEFNAHTKTECSGLSEEVVRNRTLLRSTLEKVGFINYPPEWWHFSHGDRLWAELTGQKQAFFAPLD